MKIPRFVDIEAAIEDIFGVFERIIFDIFFGFDRVLNHRLSPNNINHLWNF